NMSRRKWTRREALKFASTAGLGLIGAVGASALAGCGSTNGFSNLRLVSGLPATLEAAEGPFFVDEGLNRSELVSPGASRATVVNATSLVLTIRVNSSSGAAVTPLVGAHVDVWQADSIGIYSDEPDGVLQSENTTGQTWLRGYQLTDTSGNVTFQTIIP